MMVSIGSNRVEISLLLAFWRRQHSKKTLDNVAYTLIISLYRNIDVMMNGPPEADEFLEESGHTRLN